MKTTELDRQIVVSLGGTLSPIFYKSYFDSEGVLKNIPHFSSTPGILVRLIDSRGWNLAMYTNFRWSDKSPKFSARIGIPSDAGIGFDEYIGESETSLWEALCYAFLKANEYEKSN